MAFPWMYIYATWAQNNKYVSHFCICQENKVIEEKPRKNDEIYLPTSIKYFIILIIKNIFVLLWSWECTSLWANNGLRSPYNRRPIRCRELEHVILVAAVGTCSCCLSARASCLTHVAALTHPTKVRLTVSASSPFSNALCNTAHKPCDKHNGTRLQNSCIF